VPVVYWVIWKGVISVISVTTFIAAINKLCIALYLQALVERPLWHTVPHDVLVLISYGWTSGYSLQVVIYLNIKRFAIHYNLWLYRRLHKLHSKRVGKLNQISRSLLFSLSLYLLPPPSLAASCKVVCTRAVTPRRVSRTTALAVVSR